MQYVEYFGESQPSLSLTDEEAAMTHLFWLSDDAWERSSTIFRRANLASREWH